ncbi:hypothetical protein GCM10025857_13490 [Alicyclobacillus contaminans]|uniref:hypothetical protein n=1 Tax=Alicyclobacillus contaminans TaxID=392016 RepID=UPI00041AE1EA|nr:hypothetical protein [Alicyclobacillus contaminans]GMA49992.1 hypothetical protein GCM10025857_13490 [Alicyclobacillus contaminans]
MIAMAIVACVVSYLIHRPTSWRERVLTWAILLCVVGLSLRTALHLWPNLDVLGPLDLVFGSLTRVIYKVL